MDVMQAVMDDGVDSRSFVAFNCVPNRRHRPRLDVHTCRVVLSSSSDLKRTTTFCLWPPFARTLPRSHYSPEVGFPEVIACHHHINSPMVSGHDQSSEPGLARASLPI